MDNFFNKLENYNIFNYILPAIIFDIGCKIYINLTIIPTSNVVIAAFAYYFVGLVISRIGSLIIKPLLWKLKILNKEYSSKEADFYKAEEKDPKIKILFTDYNMYRNFISVFFLLLIVKIVTIVQKHVALNSTLAYTIIILLLLVLFILSYKKQLQYIYKRVNNMKKNSWVHHELFYINIFFITPFFISAML